MTVADMIRFCLEFDQQVVSPRPSDWGKMAEVLAVLADHAEPSLRDPGVLGDWRSVDLSPVRRRAPSRLDQPVIDGLQARADRDAAADAERLDWLDETYGSSLAGLIPFGDGEGSVRDAIDAVMKLEAAKS